MISAWPLSLSLFDFTLLPSVYNKLKGHTLVVKLLLYFLFWVESKFFRMCCKWSGLVTVDFHIVAKLTKL